MTVLDELTAALATVQERSRECATTGQQEWQGEPTTIVIADSNTALQDAWTLRAAVLLARTCRTLGYRLHLVGTGYGLDAFGGSAYLRAEAALREHVTYALRTDQEAAA
jgi:hypothetical protein